jgi:hypothetical protein
MKGAIIFLAMFFAFLAATLAYPTLPPGENISNAINVDPTVEWNGLLVRTLASAIFNGVVYGIIAWITFTVIEKTRKPLQK